MTDSNPPKPKPKQYPLGFSFWETKEYGDAVVAAAEASGLNTTGWLRQTIRMRLWHEGWVERKGVQNAR